MQIFINHQLAAIKRDSTFDFVAENRYFSGADSYTLAITFPLKDCPQNLAIFGHINRKDIVAQHLLFDCEIRDKAFVQYGSITITEINDTEVKCQFLEGRSVQNYAITFDEIYINEMTLGYPSTNPVGLTSAVFSKDIDDGLYYLPFQWVNNYSGNMQNRWEDNGIPINRDLEQQGGGRNLHALSHLYRQAYLQPIGLHLQLPNMGADQVQILNLLQCAAIYMGLAGLRLRPPALDGYGTVRAVGDVDEL